MPPESNRRLLIVGPLLCWVLCSVSATAGAQQLTAAPAGAAGTSSNHSRVQLQRRIALDLQGVSLGDALDSIRIHGAIDLAYSSQAISGVAKRIAFRGSAVTVQQALEEALDGTAWTYRALESGQIVVVRRRTDVTPARGEGAGGVHGVVTDAKTHMPLSGAKVQIESTLLLTVTDAEGRYQIANVPPGPHVVVVRRLGYAMATRTVAVTVNEDVAVDVALEQSASTLDRVVVTGTIVPTEVKAIPTPVSIVDAAQLERDNITRVDEIFRAGVPGGVSWEQGVLGYTNSLTVRGANVLAVGQNAMKIYVDGVEVSNDLYSTFDVNSIRRIEVVRGPEASTMYGSGATGGVLQVFTKRGDPTLQRPQFNATISAGTIQRPERSGVAAYQNYSATLQGGAEGLSYNVGASYRQEGAWVPEYYSRTPSLFGATTVHQGAVTVDVSGRYQEEAFPRVATPRLAATGQPQYTTPMYEANRIRSQTYGIQVSYAASPTWEHHLVIGYDRVNDDDYNVRPRLMSPADTFLKVLEASYQKPSLRYNTSVRFPVTTGVSSVVTAGFDLFSSQQDGFLTYQALQTAPFITMAAGSVPFVTRIRGHNEGYFAQGQFALHDAWFLTLGLRAERNADFGPDFGTAFSPRAGLAYVHDFGDLRFKARASYGEALRPPPAGFGVGVPPDLVGNPNIAPERERGGDGGVDLQFGDRGTLSVTVYSQNAIDLIDYNVVDSSAVPPTRQPVNVGRIRNNGVEVEGMIHVGEVSLHGEYTRMKSTVKKLSPFYTGDLRVGDHLLGVPQGTGALTMTVPVRGRTTITGTLTWIGRWTNYDWLAFFGGEPFRGSLRAYWTEYPAVTKLNLAVTHAFGSHISGFVDVHNLTDNLHAEQDNLAVLSGRRTTVGLRLSY